MTQYIVVGAGMMGRVIAKDLLDSQSDVNVDLRDRDSTSLSRAVDFIGSDRLSTRVLDVEDKPATLDALSGNQVAIGALPHSLSLPLIESAIEAKVSLVDIVGKAPEKRRELNGRARETGCLIVPGCGCFMPSHVAPFFPSFKGFCRIACCNLLHAAAIHRIIYGGRKGRFLS